MTKYEWLEEYTKDKYGMFPCNRCNTKVFFKPADLFGSPFKYTQKCKYCKASLYPSKLGLQMSRLIYDLFKIKTQPFITRLYSGYYQRSSGAWTWTMESLGSRKVFPIGSCETATSIIKAHKKGIEIVLYNAEEIIIENNNQTPKGDD